MSLYLVRFLPPKMKDGMERVLARWFPVEAHNAKEAVEAFMRTRVGNDSTGADLDFEVEVKLPNGNIQHRKGRSRIVTTSHSKGVTKV